MTRISVSKYRQGATVRNAEILKGRATELRRMAERAREVERERKMLALADQFEEAATAAGHGGAPENEDR